MPVEIVDKDIETYGNVVIKVAKERSQSVAYTATDILNKVYETTKTGETGITSPMIILPGIHLDSVGTDKYANVGPSYKKIMMVGSWPNSIEEKEKRLFHGDWTIEFKDLMSKTGLNINDVYLTTFVKTHVHGKKTTIPKDLIEDYMPMFKKELELVKPDLLIILGAKVLKALFGAKATMEQYKNRTLTAEESPLSVKTTAITDFSAVLHVPEMRGGLEMELTRIAEELNSNTTQIVDDVHISYTYCYSLDHLENSLKTIESEYSGWVSVDCEWGGRNHVDGELRCIQFSWTPGKALVIVFNHAGMTPTQLGCNKVEAWKLIKKFIENGRTRLVGHFIRADLPWMVSNGVDVTLSVLFGWDTALAGHLLNENWAQGLEVYTSRHTKMGRYELALNNWIKNNKYDVDVHSYGGIPDDILFEYAAKDADVTFRIFQTQNHEMNLKENIKIKSLFETVVMPATMPILEMEMTGMGVDVQRLELLSQKYSEKRRELVDRLKEMLNWSDFNPDSSIQKAAALFGWIKPGAKTNPPSTATLKRFEPIKATNEKKWSDVIKNPETIESYTPSTERAVIQELLLSHKDDEFLNTMLLYTAVSQTVKTFCGSFVVAEDGSHFIEGGILPKLWSDGRTHTKIRQTVETGRYGHSDPNMAQLPKTAEDLVGRAFKDTGKKIPSIRSCFRADPGWALLDCDWVQAELFVMAWLSKDGNMQQKLNDPGSDFHSEVAIDMFRLPKPPADYSKGLKEWLKESGNGKYRTIAKTITFGIAYGRGAAAIRQAVYMEGINITVEEAQDSVDKFKETFPNLAYWLELQQACVGDNTQGYVENGFGRKRRFDKTKDKELISHQKRQAMNAPIQGTVGDLMSLALVNLFLIRNEERPHLKYKIIMSVHDQVIVTCPVSQVEETLEVIKIAMCDRCRIPGNDLLLNIDPEVCIRWGEPLTDEDVTQFPVLSKYKK